MSEINIDNFRKDELLTELLSVRTQRDKLQAENERLLNAVGMYKESIVNLEKRIKELANRKNDAIDLLENDEDGCAYDAICVLRGES